MGLIDRYKTGTPAGWKAGPDEELEFDFDRNALCGVALRESAKLLWKLGPPDNPDAANTGVWQFFAWGLQVDVRAEAVEGYVLFFNEALNAPNKSFGGPCRFRGRVLDRQAAPTESGLLEFFGEPCWRDEDEQETVWFYSRNAAEWQIEISKTCGLSAIVITALPLLTQNKMAG